MCVPVGITNKHYRDCERTYWATGKGTLSARETDSNTISDVLSSGGGATLPPARLLFRRNTSGLRQDMVLKYDAEL